MKRNPDEKNLSLQDTSNFLDTSFRATDTHLCKTKGGGEPPIRTKNPATSPRGLPIRIPISYAPRPRRKTEAMSRGFRACIVCRSASPPQPAREESSLVPLRKSHLDKLFLEGRVVSFVKNSEEAGVVNRTTPHHDQVFEFNFLGDTFFSGFI